MSTLRITPMCTQKYDRMKRLKAAPFQPLFCTNPCAPGSETCIGPHSWQNIYDSDSQALDAVIDRMREHVVEQERTVIDPVGIQALQDNANAAHGVLALEAEQVCTGLDEGRYDPYLEAILAAGHNRKRKLRGVRSF